MIRGGILSSKWAWAFVRAQSKDREETVLAAAEAAPERIRGGPGMEEDIRDTMRPYEGTNVRTC